MLEEATNFYLSAMRTAPSELSYKQGFIDFIGEKRAFMHDDSIGDALVECLNLGSRLELSRLYKYWFEHNTAHPEFHAAFALKDRKPFDPENSAFFEKISDYKPLFTPCFLLGVKNFIVLNPLFEEFIVHVRKQLLAGKFTPEESLVLADAISHYSFNTDFILDCTEEEQKAIDALRFRIEAGQYDIADIALFACYAPLYALKNANEIMQKFSASASMADIIKTQISNYLRLREISESIVTITPIDSATSEDVREQYEEFPYPRWTSFSLSAWIRSWEATLNREILNLRDKKLKILNAGCGTGNEAILLASMFPKSEVLAVDLSRTSLAYAVKKAEEYGIKNITFRQADIQHLGVLDQQFDYISSVGVLHHMKDPVAGWKVLSGLLKPKGLMTIGLYSKIARTGIIKTRKIAREAGYTGDAASMKSFRKKSPQILDPDVLKNISSFRDYYSLSMYRDLLFHVQEYNYDLLEIESILKKLNMDFICFEQSRSLMQEYERRFPNDPAKTNLANWSILENDRPSATGHMYTFWCRKGSYTTPSYKN